MKETYSIPIHMSYILDLYIGPIYRSIYSRPRYRPYIFKTCI